MFLLPPNGLAGELQRRWVRNMPHALSPTVIKLIDYELGKRRYSVLDSSQCHYYAFTCCKNMDSETNTGGDPRSK